MAAPLDFMPVDIDMPDDPKIFAIMEDLGGDDESARWCAYGRLVALMQRVYHDGFYMVYGRFERRKLARDLGLTGEEMDSFVEKCVECEIFDASVWRDLGALTSRGIQRRYFKAKKTGKASVSEEDRPYLLLDLPRVSGTLRDPGAAPDCSEDADSDDAADGAENRRESPRNAENRRAVPASLRESPSGSGIAPRIAEPSEDKRREEKKRKEKERKRPAGAGRGGRRQEGAQGISSLLAGTHPLACMSAVSDPGGEYFDDVGASFSTPWDAVASTFSHVAPGRNLAAFAGRVADMCPEGCPCTLERVEGCARIVQSALRKFDPARGSDPFPLVRRIIEDERGDSS